MKNQQKNLHIPGASVEVAKLARTVEIDGITVSVRCFRVHEPEPHYELLVTSRGESGVIDVPIGDGEDALEAQIEEAAICFATALRLRSDTFS